MSKELEEIKIGYGFNEIEQNIDGIYCEACMVVHKRPTKMYADRPEKKTGRVVMCGHGLKRFYTIEE